MLVSQSQQHLVVGGGGQGRRLQPAAPSRGEGGEGGNGGGTVVLASQSLYASMARGLVVQGA